MTTTRLVLCRHAEPAALDRFCGAEVGLSSEGERQARALAAALADSGIERVYSSPLGRARETAEPVAAACGVELVELPALAEIDFGALEGLTHDHARAEFPDVYAAWLESPAKLRFPGGESLADVRARVTAAAGEIVERHRGATVALVSHAGPLRALIASCLLVPDEALFRIALDHASTSAVDWADDGVPIVRSVNRRSASPAPGG